MTHNSRFASCQFVKGEITHFPLAIVTLTQGCIIKLGCPALIITFTTPSENNYFSSSNLHIILDLLSDVSTSLYSRYCTFVFFLRYGFSYLVTSSLPTLCKHRKPSMKQPFSSPMDNLHYPVRKMVT